MNSPFAALAGRIRQSLLDLEQVIGRIELLLGKVDKNGDDDYVDGIALNLHGFYTGVKVILDDIARNVEGSVPAGPNWHQELLLQLSAPMSSLRPAVITRETRFCLDEFRGFRHVVRNVYSFHLKPERVKELAQEVRICFDAVQTDLDGFCRFLENMTE